MSTITVNDVFPKEHSELIKSFSHKLNELSVLEKELKTNGFNVEISYSK